MAHDVSAELRGYHGRWSKTGVLKRLANEAISDSGWEDLPDDGGEADTQDNLKKIAKQKKGKNNA